MELVVKLVPDAARPGAAQDVVIAAITRLGLRLEMQSLGGVEVLPGGYVVAVVPREQAERIVKQVRGLSGVETAYVTPRGEPASGDSP
jgi:hypothetical protein